MDLSRQEIEDLASGDISYESFCDAHKCTIPIRKIAQMLLSEMDKPSILRETCKKLLSEWDSFDGPEKFIGGAFPHYSPVGRMINTEHIAAIREIVLQSVGNDT